ncbi:MAG: serine palmitoyltransferase [Sphingobacterium siyangense]
MNDLFLKRVSNLQYINKLKEAGSYPYFRTLGFENNNELSRNGKQILMFGSNSYLGLTNHPKIKEAAKNAIDKYGTGCAGSRFLNGNLDIHLELEQKLARFLGKEDSLVFSTGYQVNVGLLSCLTGRCDYLLIDAYDHASIIDGCRLSQSKVFKFAHDNMEDLEKKLRKLPVEAIKLIVVEGIFSMEGNIAKLPALNFLAKKYNATIMVDDAHSLGVLGVKGAGTASHFGLTKEVDLITGTFSKTMASLGGFVAADRITIEYIKHHARSLLFGSSMSPASVASAIAALDIIQDEPELIEKLWDNTHYAKKLMMEEGFDLGNSESPIIPVYIRDDYKTFLITNYLEKEGVFVNAIVPPAVAVNCSMIRFSLMATHSFEQIEYAVKKIKNALKLFNVAIV